MNSFEESTVESQETQPNEVTPTCVTPKSTPKPCLTPLWIAVGVALLATIGLYVLHFTGGENNSPTVRHSDSTGILVLAVNNDTITDTAKYELARIRLTELSAEMEKYQQELQRKSTDFQQRLNNYMVNKQSGVLTQGQMEKTERQLTAEQSTLENLNAQYSDMMAQKQINVQREIRDSIINATHRINAKYKADYIVASGEASVIVHSNPVYDITQEVLDEMNKAYKASSK